MVVHFVHPSTFLVSGPTGSGKTQWVIKVLRNGLIHPFPQRIVWVYSEWQPLYADLNRFLRNVEFVRGFNQNLYETFDPNVTNLLVIDDQMHTAGRTKQLVELFTKGSHHRNLSVVYIVQNLFDQGRSMRTVSINSHYIVLFKSPRDQRQIMTLAQQCHPQNPAFIVQAFQEATSIPFGYLVLDYRPETPDDRRFRTNIFPSETPIVYGWSNSRSI